MGFFAVALWPLFRYNSAAPQASLQTAVTSDALWTPQDGAGRLATARVEEHRMPIEQVAPECARLVDLQQEVEWLGSGFGADATALGLPWWPAEGPVWWQEGGYLLATSGKASA